jgi:lysylphosphatidylglycerol synthetase-like protein (DUF2156 family)
MVQTGRCQPSANLVCIMSRRQLVKTSAQSTILLRYYQCRGAELASATLPLPGVVLSPRVMNHLMPVSNARLRLVETVLPLTVIETSHVMGSIVGVLLLLFAYGLQQRLRWAWARGSREAAGRSSAGDRHDPLQSRLLHGQLPSAGFDRIQQNIPRLY